MVTAVERTSWFALYYLTTLAWRFEKRRIKDRGLTTMASGCFKYWHMFALRGHLAKLWRSTGTNKIFRIMTRFAPIGHIFVAWVVRCAVGGHICHRVPPTYQLLISASNRSSSDAGPNSQIKNAVRSE